jgi:hypothetical protein
MVNKTHWNIVAKEGLLYLFIVTMQQDAFTRDKDIFRDFIKDTFQFFIEAVPHIISSIFCWRMNVQKNDMTPATS